MTDAYSDTDIRVFIVKNMMNTYAILCVYTLLRLTINGDIRGVTS